MRNDVEGPGNPDRVKVRAEETRGERPDGGASGAAVRAGMVAGAGVLLFVAASRGAAALLDRMAGDWVPPWMTVTALTGAAVLAIAGMALVARALRPEAVAAREANAGSAPGAADHRAAPEAVTGALPDAGNRAATPTAEPITRFQVESRGRREVISAGTVEWIEAEGNYVRLHQGGRSFLYRAALSRLERQTEPGRFVRVHRSALVNLEAVREVVPLPSGDAEIRLASGAAVRLSRRYAREFHARTGRG